MTVAIAAIFILPDFPSTTSWLTPEERRLAELRMEEDVGVGDEENKHGQTRGLVMALVDWKTWWMGKCRPLNESHANLKAYPRSFGPYFRCHWIILQRCMFSGSL